MKVETGRHAARRPRNRRGVGFSLGLSMVLTGFGLLGYVGWQFFGTNIVAHANQRRAISSLQQDWRAGQAAESGTTEFGNASALIRIPAFGHDYVVPVLEGVNDTQLESGIGHFPGTAGPGEKGNYALAGHRVTHGEPLRDMPGLGPGDKVIVETRKAVYVYELDTDPNALVVTFHDVWVVDPVPRNPARGGVEPPRDPRLITLTTCSELFHTDNRMIAFGHLVRTERK